MTKASSSWAGRQPEFQMSAQDLINIGIFGALYIATVVTMNLFAFINPLVMLTALSASIVAGGVPFMLFLTRVDHAGMVLVFAVITGGLLIMTGHPPICFAVTLACACVVEVILWLGRYRSQSLAVVGYAVYAMWYVGPLLPIFYARDAYFSGQSMSSMGPDYLAQMDRLLSPTMLIAFDVSTLLFGLLGGLLGLRLLRKHFEKAGLA